MKPPPVHALVNQLVAHTLGLLIFGGSLGLGAVWMRQEISATANRNRLLALKIADTERRLDEVNAEVATALNPASLLSRNNELRLALVPPAEPQVTRVLESPELLLAAKLNREIFSVNPASLTTASPPAALTVVTTTYR